LKLLLTNREIHVLLAAGVFRYSAKASGGGQQKIDETARQAEQFKKMYANPAVNVALTFAEVFPIGLVVTLLSAGISGKKTDSPKQ
jgi:hypothetical protein